jgi:RNA polymerase sigma-70 factor (ECF subfamily)
VASEEDLVRAAQGGDAAAFEELVRRTTRLVYARLYLEVGDRHRAEDLVQETYLRAWSAIGSVTEPAGFRSWLMTVAQSAALDHFRKEGRQKRAAPPREDARVLEGTAGAGPSPDESLERGERREQVRAVLQSLPDDYRMAMTLRYIDGEDYEAISMQLGLSNGALRGRLNRGMSMLREAVKRLNGGQR